MNDDIKNDKPSFDVNSIQTKFPGIFGNYITREMAEILNQAMDVHIKEDVKTKKRAKDKQDLKAKIEGLE